MTTEYIEHKLLYYSTRDKFDDEVENIAPTSIAFIGDQGLIYTHKKFFGGGNNNGDAIQADLDKIKMEIGDDTDTKLQILMNRINGTISLLATKNYVDSELTDFSQSLNITNTVKQVLDAQTPSWSVLVQRIGRLEGKEQEVLDQIASITASLAGHDGEPGSVVDLTAVYERIRALEDADAALETWKTRAEANIQALANGNLSSVQISAIYEQLDALNNKITSARSAMESEATSNNAKWRAYTEYITDLNNWRQTTSAQIDLLSNADQASITLSAIYNALNSNASGADQIKRDIAAKIFLEANADGSSITLSADKINFVGTSNNGLDSHIRAIVDRIIVEGTDEEDPNNPQQYAYLTPTGITFTDNTSSPKTETKLTGEDGLKHTITSGNNNGKHGYWLNSDGSGELALGNIKWNANGKLTTNGLMLAEAEAMGAANSFVIESVFTYPGPAAYYSSNYWMQKTIIKYHLCKAGFIVKYGTVELDGEVFVNGVDEYGQLGVENNPTKKWYGYTKDGTYYHTFQNASSGVTMYQADARAYYLRSVTAQGIIRQLARQHSSAWEEITKYPSDAPSGVRNTSVFADGDKVYIQFPNEVYVGSTPTRSIMAFMKRGDYNTSTTSGTGTQLVTALRTDIEEALNLNGQWTATYYYRNMGEYDSSTTYYSNDQYIDVVYVGDGNDANNYYVCLVDNTVNTDPVQDSNNNYWAKADSYLGSKIIEVRDGGIYTPEIEATQLQFEQRQMVFVGNQIITWSNNPG